jgi:hypothetical protein
MVLFSTSRYCYATCSVFIYPDAFPDVSLSCQSFAMDAILESHDAQLNHYAVPEHLRESAMRKVLTEDYGCSLAQLDAIDGTQEQVVARETLASESDIWVLDHLWLFQTAREAHAQLKEDKCLREKMRTIAQHFSTVPLPGVDDDDTETLINAIVVQLIHCAYSIKFGHEATSHLHHYVLSDIGSKYEYDATYRPKSRLITSR